MDDFEKEIKRDFLLDATDKLFQFQNILESIEDGENLSLDQAKIIFRLIHTLKGNSQASGFEDLAHALHVFEDILTLLKNEKIAADKKLIELCYKVLIKTQDAIEIYQADFEENINFSELVALIEDYNNSVEAFERKYTFAIIDDDQSIREILIGILSGEFQADYFEYGDAQYILEEIHSKKFDLILTDFKMPLLNGNDFIKNLRLTKNINSNTPIMFITGEKPEIISDQNVLKDIFFIRKPFEFPRIIYYAKLSLLKSKL